MQPDARHLATPYPAGRWSSRLDAHVRSIMRAGVISVPADASLLQVERALVAHGVHAVLVVEVRGGQPVGWATARGVLARMLGDASLVPASLAVTEPAESIAPGATAEEALGRMLERGVSRLLVRRHPDAPPEGVVTELDLIRLDAQP